MGLTWEAAYALAQERAEDSGLRMRVYRSWEGWAVGLAYRQVVSW